MNTLCLVTILVAILSHNTFAFFQGGPCIRNDGLRGVCSSKCKETCTSTLPGDVCGFRGVKAEDAIGCCIEKTESQFPKIDEICSLHHRSSASACYGKAPATTQTAAPPYGHVASVGWSSLNGIKWNCGGALISENHVLTTANCLVKQYKTPEYVRVGFEQLSDIPEQGDYIVIKVIFHPEFDPSQLYHDLAVLQVTKANPQYKSPTHDHRPACLWTHEDYKSRDATVFDYKERSLVTEPWSLIDNNECRSKHPIDEFIPNGINDGQFCAVGGVKGKPICDEFPRNALTLQSGNIPFVVGISAYRRNCVQSTPTVYTRLYRYLPWIEEVLSYT